MSKITLDTTDMTAIGDAIRTKLGVGTPYKAAEMPAAILSIPGGITPTGTISINSNGSYDVTQYASAEVNVSGGGSEPALPGEYQRVEYLEFTPSVGIVVTLPTSGSILFTADYIATNNSHSSDVFGYRLSSTSSKDFEMRVNSGYTSNYIRTESSVNGLALDTNRPYTYGARIKSSILLVDPRATALIGKYAYNYSSSGVDSLALEGKFYSLIGVDLVTLENVAWFVPCYRKSDNQVGVYDHIAHAFYYETYGVGSGYSIVAGPDV